MPEGNRKPPETDPEVMARLLELELAEKRAAWKRSNARLKNLRLLAFFFLFLVIGGSFFGFYLFFSPDNLGEMKARKANSAVASPSPTASPR
ncbi:MAG: hypothetical protein ACXWFY_00800 [Chthoniobacterales bacterium]